MKILGIGHWNKAKLGDPGYNADGPKPFKNISGKEVGTYIIHNGKPYIVTAIVRITDNQFKIYGMDPKQCTQIEQYKDLQNRREGGQVNVYLAGTWIKDIKVV